MDLRRPGGTQADVAIWAAGVRGYDLAPTDRAQAEPRFVAIVRDITERARADKLLRDATTSLSLMVKASNTVLWDWGLNTNTVHFSIEWKSQLGYEEHEIVAGFGEWERRVHPVDLGPTKDRVRRSIDFWARHVHPDDRAWAVPYCRTESAAGRNHRFRYRMLAADGARCGSSTM